MKKCKNEGTVVVSYLGTMLSYYFVAPAMRNLEVAVSTSINRGEEPSQPHTEGDSLNQAEPALHPNTLSGRDMSEQQKSWRRDEMSQCNQMYDM